ncbi:hypothetical protein N836_23895 [Leptolyngbya sp. Heron Island J]|uniref:DUF4149 domain-containing protein n=1 Tax=Leptolyngbya sp. Heron Island J TaxID=1385935 RepID=UPI0003B98A8A|nr:DUF4149 domain-containing protein [Leptolyngbya sp. Heron Island J]ESA33108.1 hypothetical protein N836_23895 [Leptolyngbya sp. Heron Island J]
MINLSLSFPKLTSRQFAWDSAVLFLAVFWLGGSLILDLVVMPMLYTAGMMTSPGFASAGYGLFEVFNHVEMLLSGLILTGVLAMRQAHADCSVEVSGSRSRWALLLAISLVAIALTYTYVLTPYMGALGIALDMPGMIHIIPNTMGWMHGAYWLLEVTKMLVLGALLRLCYIDIAAQFTAKN